MKQLNYGHKPEAITSPMDLIKFVKGIPAKFWCVDTRDNHRGQYCILGHLYNAYGTISFRTPTDGFTQNELAVVNNGVMGSHANLSPHRPKAKLDGTSIKRRLLKFLRENIDRKPRR